VEHFGDPVDTHRYNQERLAPKAFQKIEELRGKIVEVLRNHHIEVLDRSVLDLQAPRLKAGEEVYLEEPLLVMDAFFFRGM
jgi:hypothetical protein